MASDYSVACSLIDGPREGEIIPLHLAQCQSLLPLERNGWFGRTTKGNIAQVTTPRPKDSAWVAYTLDMYEKVAPVKNYQVQYRFVQTIEIHRCLKFLPLKKRYCRYPAVEGSEYCEIHGDGK